MGKTISSVTRTYTPAARVDGWRLFDLALGVPLAVVLAPLIACLAVLVLICDGRPVFFLSERMRGPDRGFTLIKLRTMRGACDQGPSGGHKAHRVTRLGRILRAARLDELPQIFNILRGDMGFVGPRPPLRAHVAAFPALYARVLRTRPGVTGLATIYFAPREPAILGPVRCPAEAERIYRRRCIPRKARLDLIWQSRRSVVLDLAILLATPCPALIWPQFVHARATMRRIGGDWWVKTGK